MAITKSFGKSIKKLNLKIVKATTTSSEGNSESDNGSSRQSNESSHDSFSSDGAAKQVYLELEPSSSKESSFSSFSNFDVRTPPDSLREPITPGTEYSSRNIILERPSSTNNHYHYQHHINNNNHEKTMISDSSKGFSRDILVEMENHHPQQPQFQQQHQQQRHYNQVGLGLLPNHTTTDTKDFELLLPPLKSRHRYVPSMASSIYSSRASFPVKSPVVGEEPWFVAESDGTIVAYKHHQRNQSQLYSPVIPDEASHYGEKPHTLDDEADEMAMTILEKVSADDYRREIRTQSWYNLN